MFKVAPSPRRAFQTADYGDYVFEGHTLENEIPLPLARRKVRRMPIIADQDRLVAILHGDIDTTEAIERVPRMTDLIVLDRRKVRRARAVRLLALLALGAAAFVVGVRYHDAPLVRAARAVVSAELSR